MQYNKRLSILLGVLFIIALCFANNIEGFNTPPVKAKNENGKDTLITVKK